MSDAMDLLDSLDGVSTYTAQPETEGHIVVGEDRFITVPEGLRRIAVQNDHNIETVTFDCPRYWDDHDMSKMRVYVNYQRPDGVTGTYLCGEVWVDEANENIMHFNWTVGGHATVEDGKLIIQVCVKRTENDTEINHWNSELNEDLYISKGLNCSLAVPTNQPTQRKMRTLEENGVTHITPDEGYLLEQVTIVTNVLTDTAPDPIQPSDVNFYDYDGTILVAYTLDEAAALTELPALPEHEGLVCQGWNYDLETVKARKRPLNVGALYITDDRKTRLYITIDEFSDTDASIMFSFLDTVDGGPVTIEWGDGTSEETMYTTDARCHSVSHTYAETGDYVISITVPDGQLVSLGDDTETVDTAQHNVFGVMSNTVSYQSSRLRRVELGANTEVVLGYGGGYAFYNCTKLESITIPKEISDIGSDTFGQCYSLRHINLPAVGLRRRAFRETRGMGSISIGPGYGSWGDYAFLGSGVVDFIVPEGVTSIPPCTFTNTSAMTYLQFPSTVASISTNALQGNASYAIDFRECSSVPVLASADELGAYLWVPSELHAEWITADNWSTYASKTLPAWGEE